MAEEEFDPEMLPAQEKIRHAEQLIRQEHRVLADDYLFWGNLADLMNSMASLPDLNPGAERPRDRRQFNYVQDLATGYIRMSARLAAGEGDNR
jgi:hypothetical protein